MPHLSARIDRFLPHTLTALESPSLPTSLVPATQGSQFKDLAAAAAVRYFLPRTLNDLIGGVTGSITTQLNKLRYLGPLRSYPPRHLTFSPQYDSNWFAGGGYTWDVLRRDADVRQAVNNWLSAPNRLQTPYELVLRELVSIDDLEGPLLEGLEMMPKDAFQVSADPKESYESEGEMIAEATFAEIKEPELEASRLKEAIRRATIEKVNELILIDRRSHTVVSHRDIGIGVSQVLPVLVSAFGTEHSRYRSG